MITWKKKAMLFSVLLSACSIAPIPKMELQQYTEKVPPLVSPPNLSDYVKVSESGSRYVDVKGFYKALEMYRTYLNNYMYNLPSKSDFGITPNRCLMRYGHMSVSLPPTPVFVTNDRDTIINGLIDYIVVIKETVRNHNETYKDCNDPSS